MTGLLPQLSLVTVLFVVTLLFLLDTTLRRQFHVQDALVLVGLLAVIRQLLVTAWSLIQGLRAHVLTRLLPGYDLAAKFGKWAVVTGSTDGIGKAYAEELARRGINIVLISRTSEKLKKVAADIEARHHVQTKIIVADFSKGHSVYKNIKEQLKDIPVGILVNNVGSQYSYPMFIEEVPEQEIWNIINVNIGATTMMTKLILPQMKQRKCGAIVNVSSGSELQPLPLMTIYAASKVFVKNFSQALRHEYKDSGITVQHLSPLFVTTKMNSFSERLLHPNLFVPDASTYSHNAIKTLGVVDHTTGYGPHGLQYWFCSLPPVSIRTYIGDKMNRVFRQDYFKSTGKST